ncbi:uncharacterized protein C8Q71DRAFT_334755 [Rhodofomes roseus]|uniref:Transcription factor CBF/NF-Y/archaeal histone domain-containing protein n=1 Tax=Rhodofomes roseus TaxID=34475 RepID=A0ABQ8KRU7_9APHY|nr:uncharacterized protein C8Q71DRAFT_334755 [Rhodofomes roseus]KAH9841535.1 hypothetical protein C8Q71DRAFT_334755 [Rhodofomes roseus]
MALGSNSVSISALRQSTHDELSVDDEEIDQLDSGLDSEEEVDELEDTVPVVSKARPKKTGERVPGHTLIPPSRVENILQGSEAGAHLSKEALYMLSVATEEFIKRLAHAGQRMAGKEARQLVYYRDVAAAAQRHHEFKFADDVIPPPMSIAEALDLRAAREKELADADPALAPSVDPWAIPPSSDPSTPQDPSAAMNARTKSRSRQSHANGNEETDGSVSTTYVSRPRQRDPSGRYSASANGKPSERRSGSASARSSVGTRPGSSRIRDRASRASDGGQYASIDSPSSANGTPSISRGGMGPPAPPRPSSSLSNRMRAEDGRSNHSKPPNGFTDDHRLLNGSSRGSGIADAPGRTIYSARATQSNR